MPAEIVLAIDLGSSWCKAAYVNRHGSLIAEGRVVTRAVTDHADGWLERFWRAVTEAVRLAGAGLAPAPHPAAIAVSCRGLFGACLDRGGGAFIPSYDVLGTKRSPDVAAAFQSPVWGDAGPYAHGYAVRLAGLAAGVRAKAPEDWRRIHRIGALHDYVIYRLCGEWVTDPTTGPGALVWPRGLLELSGLPLAAFPTILNPWAVAGGLSPQAAAILALPADLPVVAGLHDGAAANVGTGTVHPGDACLTLGTNFAVRVVTGNRPQTDCFGYVVAPGQWAWVNSVPSVATQLDLVAATLVATPVDLAAKHDLLGALAMTVAPDVRLPPLSLGDTAALLASLADAHRRGFSNGEVYLAMLRRAAAGLRHLVERAAGDGATAARFVATGGGARNAPLLRVLAATLRTAIEVGHPEAGLIGAGMVAAIGAGWYPTLADARSAMVPSMLTVHEPAASARSSGKVCA
jgi:xylulokinase